MNGNGVTTTDVSASEQEQGIGNATKKGRWIRLRDYLDEEVSTGWGDAVLIISCFVTGILDSAVFNVWSCFVSMQTGNTVYVGLGFSGQPRSQPYRWIKSLTAILFFILGTFLFSRLMRYLNPLRRVTVIISFILQALLCFVSALLGVLQIVPTGAGNMLPENFIVCLPLALLSMQSAGQIVMSRFLGYGEVTTVVLTSAYCDLIFDPTVFTTGLRGNSKRNRRMAAALMLLAGAVIGGFLTLGGEVDNALWLAGGIKVALAIGYGFWSSKDEGRLRLD